MCSRLLFFISHYTVNSVCNVDFTSTIGLLAIRSKYFPNVFVNRFKGHPKPFNLELTILCQKISLTTYAKYVQVKLWY